MAADLHLHSTASDGVDSPRDVMRLAAEAGVTVAALTDHDTLDGLEEAAAAAREVGIRLIHGVELSVDHNGVKIHMLVYFTDPGSQPLEEKLHALRDGRDVRNILIVERLNELGFDVSLADVLDQAKGASVGRPHIADALIDKGYFDSRDEAFVDLLRDGGQAYFPRDRMTAVQAITLARDSGCVPVIAHPLTMQVPESRYGPLFRDLADIGLGGIEAHHSMHDQGLRDHLTSIAHDLGLAATGGSDYHGAGKRAYDIATGTGDLRVPMAAVEELDAQRAR